MTRRHTNDDLYRVLKYFFDLCLLYFCLFIYLFTRMGIYVLRYELHSKTMYYLFKYFSKWHNNEFSSDPIQVKSPLLFCYIYIFFSHPDKSKEQSSSTN